MLNLTSKRIRSGQKSPAHPRNADLLQEPQEAAVLAERAIAICDEHGFAEGRSWGKGLLGWAHARLGSAAEDAALIREGMTTACANGARV
jgi:hypothetical protein